MSIEEAFDWAKTQRAEWDKLAKEHPMVTKLDTELTSGGDHPVEVLAFSRAERSSFLGEVGKNDDGDLVFHFWPTANDTFNVLMDVPEPLYDAHGKVVVDTAGQPRTRPVPTWVFGDAFESALAQSFIDVFKLEEKLCWDFVPEMNSWVVRAQGYGTNVMAHKIAERLFDKLQELLEK